MKVLVTGATGFLGRYLLPMLISRKWQVYAITRKAPNISLPDVCWIEGDLLDLNCSSSLYHRIRNIGARCLVHLAWVVDYGTFWNAEQNFSWVSASMQLLKCFHDGGGCKAVIAGTCAEYDWSYGYCREEITPCRQTSLYGQCKHALVLLAKSYCDFHRIQFCWGRIFFPFGPGEDVRRLIPSLILHLMKNKKGICINGEAYRDFLHAKDVASAFVYLLENDKAEGIFNICSGEPTKLSDLAFMIGRLLGKENLLEIGKESGEVPILVGDNRRLCSIGWRPDISLEDGIIDYIDHLNKEYALWR